jgi:hypothetical protein
MDRAQEVARKGRSRVRRKYFFTQELWPRDRGRPISPEKWPRWTSGPVNKWGGPRE